MSGMVPGEKLHRQDDDTNDILLTDIIKPSETKGDSQRKSTNKMAFRDKMQNFPDNVDMIGFKKIFESETPLIRRLLWLCFILIGIGFALYQIISQIMFYYTWPVNVYVNISHVDTLPWPRVTICNRNQVRQSSLPLPARNAENLTDMFRAGMLEGLYHVNSWEEFYNYHAHKLEEMLLECDWQGEPCNHLNFTKIYSDTGVCYAFNEEGKLSTFHADENYGLHLLLRIQTEEYIYSNTNKFNGFKVSVSEPDVPAHVRGRGLSIPEGAESYLGIRRQKILSLTEPWESCGKKPLQFYRKYSLTACHDECYTGYLIHQCGCRELYMRDKKVPVCDPVKEQSCVRPAYIQYMYNGTRAVCNCPISCDNIEYHTAYTQASFAQPFLSYLTSKYGKTDEYWRENAVELRVYYTDLVEEIVSHQPVYTVLTLLSNVGGSLGLILGTSVLVIFEVIDFFMLQFLFPSKKVQ